MKTPNNRDVIQAWSTYSHQQIETFGEEGDAARRYILNPVLLDLLGNVANCTILDAGCGTGYLSRMLARRGAQVTGVEPADALFAYTSQREQQERLGIRYIQQDLSIFTSDDMRYDRVVANMVLMDIPDYQSAMYNCIEALKSGGEFVFSLLHPCFDEIDSPNFFKGYSAKGYIRVDEYLHEFVVQQRFGCYIHRPLSAYLNLAIEAGCTIRKVIEPTLTAEGVAALGEAERNLYIPNFIVISARKN